MSNSGDVTHQVKWIEEKVGPKHLGIIFEPNEECHEKVSNIVYKSNCIVRWTFRTCTKEVILRILKKYFCLKKNVNASFGCQ